MDGSPYVNGGESRLNDRYAVVSALGAADYVPESGEYIRFFEWNRNGGNKQENKRENKTTPEPEKGQEDRMKSKHSYRRSCIFPTRNSAIGPMENLCWSCGSRNRTQALNRSCFE